MQYTEKIEKEKVFRKLERLLVDDNNLEENIRKYFETNHFGTPEQFRETFNSVYRASEGNLNAVREYLGIPKPRMATRRRHSKCSPHQITSAKTQKIELLEDVDVQLPADIEPKAKESPEEYSPQEQNPTYREEPSKEDNPVRKKRAISPKNKGKELETIAEQFPSLKETALITRGEKPQENNSYRRVPKEIMDSIIEIVAKRMSSSIENVNPNTNLSYDLGADTLDKAELYFDLEDKFGIEIREDEEESFTQKLEVIGSLAEYIIKAQKQQKINSLKEPEKEEALENSKPPEQEQIAG